MENRIIELEIKAAYQEDLLQALNNVVSQQQQQIDRLEMTCTLLNERIKSLSSQQPEGENTGSLHEIPPHYWCGLWNFKALVFNSLNKNNIFIGVKSKQQATELVFW